MAKTDLSTLWEGLKLIEDEDSVVVLSYKSLEEAALKGKNCLLILVTTDKSFNKEAFRLRMP